MKSSMHSCLPVFAVLVVWVAPTVSDATMYQCLTGSGSMVYTDRPTQLLECVDHTGKRVLPPAPSTIQGSVQPFGMSIARQGEPMDVIVPVQRAGQLLVVQAYLNGDHGARLILDTGASHTILSHELVRELGLVMDAGAAKVTLNTAGGPVEANVIKLSAIRVGEAEVQNLPVAIHDLPEPFSGVDGLLGLTFFNQFLIILDIQKNELHLKRHP